MLMYLLSAKVQCYFLCKLFKSGGEGDDYHTISSLAFCLHNAISIESFIDNALRFY